MSGRLRNFMTPALQTHLGHTGNAARPRSLLPPARAAHPQVRQSRVRASTTSASRHAPTDAPRRSPSGPRATATNKRMPQRRLPCRSGLKLRRCTTRSRAWRSGITMRPLVPRRPRDASLITLVADATRRGCLVSAGDEPTTDRARPCACGPDGRQRSGGARRTVRRPGCSGPRRRHRRPRVRRTDCACSRCGGCPDA